jgi:hypothetical protein
MLSTMAHGSSVIHRTKLFGGRETAEEVHQKLAFPRDAVCMSCKGRPMIRAIVMAPLDEAKSRGLVRANTPEELNKLIPILIPILEGGGTKHYVRLAMFYYCKPCAPAVEKVLARQVKSWMICEFNRGPGADVVISGPMG